METVDFFQIDIDETNWSTSSEVLSTLRHQVFVEEQGVPEDEEFDEADVDAIHWIAYAPKTTAPHTKPPNTKDAIPKDPEIKSGGEEKPQQQVIGCARLCGDKIGRMAIAQSFRNMGVGSALMRHIIRYAADNGMQNLQLNAQTHARDFYEGMYFEVDGDEFIEAGILHLHMTLSLTRFSHPTATPPLPDITAEQRDRITLDTAEAFAEQAKTLVKKAHRQIRIFSDHLDPSIYDHDDICDALFEFARAHPYAEIHILVKNPQPLVQRSHRLLHLYHRLPSRIAIKTLHKSIQTFHSEFMLIDKNGILYNQSSNRYAGYTVHHAPLEAIELATEYDDMWERSEPDPNMRVLPI